MGERTAAMFSGKPCNGRVLIMDDEADIRKVVRLNLEKAGYEVMEAEDGEKAIKEIHRDENPILMDVIICDIRMPKINGVEAIKYFQSQFPRVPLIVMTGHPDVGMATSFLQSGVSDYLVKPVDSEKLRAAVAKAVESKDVSFI
jgi:DNA-binding NtrC family response regulator